MHMLPKDISVPNNFWMSPIAIQLLKIYHQSSLYIDLSALFDLLLAIFFAVSQFSKYIFKFKEIFECPPLQFSCWKSIIKAACTSIWVHFFIFFCYFFAVFKMIGREHQARLELPSFGFSKVRNPYAITDHPKMMLCYKAMCPSPGPPSLHWLHWTIVHCVTKTNFVQKHGHPSSIRWLVDNHQKLYKDL